MHHLDLGLFKYQVIYTRNMLKDLCGQAAVNNLDYHLAMIQRFSGLKIFKNGLENIKQFMADEFRNMMKVFLFIIKGLIVKHHKTSINMSTTHWYNDALVNVYYYWNQMYIFSRWEHFLELDLEEFKVV